MIALRVEAVLGDDDQRAGERRTCRRHRQAFQALVVAEGLEIVRHLDRLAARGEAVAAIVEAQDLFDALDADIERAVGFGERFGIEPAARGQRLAVRPEDRRHLGVRDAGGLAVLIDDARAQPGAAVRERQEMAAVGLHVERGNAAERFVGRREREPATEFQRAETHLRRIAVVERRDRRGVGRRCASSARL